LENGTRFFLCLKHAKQHLRGRCKTKKEEEKRGARLAGKCNRQATLAEAEQARFLSPPEKFG
tara:strand:- start:470 stop:655 length:186 start_codon:yes stop_codon:yes gene_type:complete